MIYLKTVAEKVCNLKLCFKDNMELWETCFVPPDRVGLRLQNRSESNLGLQMEYTPKQNHLLLKDQTAASATRLGVITNVNVVNSHSNI